MAVYTDVSESDLSAFMKEYEVGDLLSYKGIAEGSENTNYLLHAGKGPFILTLYEKRVEAADLPFFLGLMEHLAKKEISCPLPVRRKDGELIGKIAGRPAALITFLEGMWMRAPMPAHCRQVGEALGRLHLAAADFPLTRMNALGMDGSKELWAMAALRADEVEAGLAAEVEADFRTLQENWPQKLPSGIIHADLFPDNVFFLGERLSGLIDFYFACQDFLAYDLAICLNAWCFEKDGAYNLTKGAALIAGYRGVRELSSDEIAALPVLARGAALRFMLTRLYDWLTIAEGAMITRRDPMEYVRRLRFHRRIESPAEYGVGLA